MKKIAIITALVVLGLMLFAINIGAMDFLELRDGKQVKIGSVKTDTPPIINGEVLPGEYTTYYKFTADSKGIVNYNSTVGYVEMNFAHDNDYLYIAIVIQEDEYSKKLIQDDKQYSNIFLSLGFDTRPNSLDAAKSWISNTLSMYDYATNEDGTHTEELFTGLGLYFFANESMGTQIGTDWDFMRKICLTSSDNDPEKNHRFFTRSTDANGKNITIYEFKYSFVEILRAYNEGCKGTYNANLTAIEGPFYIRWSLNQYNADRTKVGSMGFYNKTTPDQQMELMIDYGWISNINDLAHVMELYDTKAEMDSDIAEWDKNNVVEVAPPEVSETEAPGNDVTEAPEAGNTTEAPNQGTEAPGTKAPETTPATKPAVTTANGGDEGSCGGFTAIGAVLALVAITGAAIVIKKK